MTLDLPSRASAVALASMGFIPVKPKVDRNDRTGRMILTWRMEGPAILQAQQILASVGNQDPARDLLRARPEHPYLCGLYYQENADALRRWMEGGARPLVLRSGPASRLLRLLPDAPALRPHDLAAVAWLPSTVPAGAVSDPALAAVAVLCGFVPRSTLDFSAGPPRIVFTADSLTFPGLRLEDLQRASAGSTIGNYPAGDHPACYALACAVNHADFLQAETIAARNPSHQFKGRGQASAIMTENLLTSAADPRFRDALRKHLALPT